MTETERNTQGLRDRSADDRETEEDHAGDPDPAGGEERPGRGGRPANPSETVQWWKPGWQKQFH
jgi:hypothetical protein